VDGGRGRLDPRGEHGLTATPARSLLLFAQGATWEARFQVSSCAAAAAAAGQRVDLAFFFAALGAWVGDRWDDHQPAEIVAADRLTELAPPLTALLADGREAGTIRLYACSASMRYLDLDPAAVQAKVDAIVGWSTFHRLMRGAEQVVGF
jgi:predicted peroxiredoxin